MTRPAAALRVPYGYRGAGLPGALPEASIVTVLDGDAPGLLATASAVAEQSFQAFEWIVVAGGVPAHTGRALKELSQADTRIRVIETADRDAAAARRLGLDAARSPRRWEIAAGDTPAPTAVEQALWALESGVGRGDADPAVSFETIPVSLPFRNRLERAPGVRRVLLALPWLDVSGVERFACDLIGRLQARQHQVSVCATLSGEGRWRGHFTDLTGDVFGLPGFLRPADVPRFLVYLIESRGIDVVLTSNSYLTYQLLPFLRSRCPRVALVDYVHMEAEHWRNGGVGRVSVAHQELLDLTVVSTEHLRRWMIGRGARAERIEVCHTNVDTGTWNPADVSAGDVRRQLAVPEDAPVLLCAARLSPQKRPLLLAEVVRRLARVEGRGFVCVVAGDGPELPALRAFVAEHGLEDRMRLVGTVSPERMRELQAAADVFFLPSLYEGLSLTLFEAMAMETVPVAADVGGQRELVTPECGVLVPVGDGEIDRYVEVLRGLLDSPARRRELAAAARARVATHFALDTMGDRMAELLDRACELARIAPRVAVGSGLGLESATLVLEYRRLERERDLLESRAAAAESRADAAESAAKGAATRLEALERELADLRESARVAGWSAEAIARAIGLRRIVQALAFRVAGTPGLTWLRAFRGLGRSLLGG
jgi:glycosyltransferase involved in cell wall biosynthesis